MAEATVVALAATSNSVTVLVLAASASQPPDMLGLSIGEWTANLGSNWHYYRSDHSVIWYQKRRINGLRPGTRYELELREDGTRAAAAASFWTLTSSTARSFTLVVGSCFDIESDAADRLAAAYDAATEPSRAIGVPTYNVWSGDQVYVDAPWRRVWKSTQSRSVILDKYMATWGLHGRGVASGLNYAMTKTSNWYLPDDHEFWNGYPHPSFLTLPTHAVGWVLRQALRRLRSQQFPDAHPFFHGEWGQAAAEAFCLFQSDCEFRRFDEHVSPPQIQRIETDSSVIALADCRWFRTIRKTGGRAGFMREQDLAEVVQLLRTDERLVCLVLSRPVVGRLPHQGPVRGKIEYAPEDYSRQYKSLWAALSVRATSRLPTLIVAGDVHEHSVRTALDDHLLEVVSSPLALLRALGEQSRLSKVRATWAKLKRATQTIWYRMKDMPLPGDDPLAYPVMDDSGSWVPASGQSLYEGAKDDSGIAALSFDLSDPTRPVIGFRNVAIPAGEGSDLVVTDHVYRWDGKWTRRH